MKTQRSICDLGQVQVRVPPLPAAISYFDDFSDSYAEVVDPNGLDRWPIRFDGRDTTLDFDDLDLHLRSLVKCWCAIVLAELSPVTAYKYLEVLKTIPMNRIIGLVSCSPQDVRSQWKELHASGLVYGAFAPLSSILEFLCRFSIGAWGPEWVDLISQLPYPKIDKYARVRVGDVFLTSSEEAAIVRCMDEVCKRIGASDLAVPDTLLIDTAILLCSFQFGLRAKQIAMLQVRNIRVWKDGVDTLPAVHLTFMMIKQRTSRRVFPMVRRVKREWAPLFVELLKRSRLKGLGGMDHVFQRTPSQVSQTVADLTESLSERRRSTNELRHTAAQRLVDHGASEEELATFMGHTDLNTGLIYFNSSASQAARINQALGVSATFKSVAKIAHERFITGQELAELKGDQQVGGVPHGIPIVGIGGCSLGQPNCPYNPVTSCYGCSRFMPISIAAVHQQVLEDLRDVMKFFYASSHAERGSPAFQLASTISNVQAVLDELGGQHHELQS